MQICLGQKLNLFHICHGRLVSTSPSPERGAAPGSGWTDWVPDCACPALLQLWWTRWTLGFHQRGRHSPFPCKPRFWSFDTSHATGPPAAASRPSGLPACAASLAKTSGLVFTRGV